jgi:hypothetical protein
VVLKHVSYHRRLAVAHKAFPTVGDALLGCLTKPCAKKPELRTVKVR